MNDIVQVSSGIAVNNFFYVIGNQVGINTSLPDSELSVNGSISVTKGLKANGSYGVSGYVLKTNGSNSVYWEAATGNTIASAAGSNTQIQYNLSGNFAASANLTFDGNTLFINSASVNSSFYSATSNNSLYLNGKTELYLNVNSSLTSNNSSYLNNKSESNLNVNNSLFSNNSSYLNGKIEVNLNVNSASYSIIANSSYYLNGKGETNLNVNSASYASTANNSSYLNGQLASFYYASSNPNLYANNTFGTANNANFLNAKSESNLNVNSSVTSLNANNSTYLNGQLATYYLNATNINAGTLNNARLNLANATIQGINYVVDSVTNTSITTAASANSVTTAYNTAISASLNSNNATYWNGAAFSSYLNQALLTTSSVTFNSLTILTSTYSQLGFSNASNAADKKQARINQDNNGAMSFEFVNDAYTASNSFLAVSRTGYSPTDAFFNLSGNLYKNSNIVLDASNYNNYAPTKTGTGASGTWAIDITGTANNSTYWNGAAFSSYLNQALLTTSTVTFSGLSAAGVTVGSTLVLTGNQVYATSGDLYLNYSSSGNINHNQGGGGSYFYGDHVIKRAAYARTTYAVADGTAYWTMGLRGAGDGNCYFYKESGNSGAFIFQGAGLYISGQDIHTHRNNASGYIHFGNADNAYFGFDGSYITTPNNVYLTGSHNYSQNLYSFRGGINNDQGDLVAYSPLDGQSNFRCRRGNNGTVGGNGFNFFWDGSYLQVYVDQYLQGGIAYVSDERVKENIVDVETTLESISKLRVVTYSMKEIQIFKDDGERKMGFIASNIYDNLPEGVKGHPDQTDKEGNIIPQTLDSTAILAATVKALQELNEIVKQQKLEIENLKNKLN